MANEGMTWRDLDNINGHKIYINKKSINNTAIIVNCIYASKMKNVHMRYHKHCMLLAANSDNKESICIANIHAPTSWSGAAA